MGCQSCGKKHPLSRKTQMARHFTSMPKRKVGKVPTPLPPPPQLPADPVPDQTVEEPKIVEEQI